MATDKDSKAPDNPLAFPQPLVCTPEGRVYRADETAPYAGGMTLRDYFAAKAMSAWITEGAIGRACQMDPSKGFSYAFGQIAESSFAIADAMLANRAEGAQ